MKIIYITIFAIALVSCGVETSTDSQIDSETGNASTEANESNMAREVTNESGTEVQNELENAIVNTSAVDTNLIAQQVVLSKEVETISDNNSKIVETDTKDGVNIPVIYDEEVKPKETILVENASTTVKENIVLVDAQVDHLVWDALVRKNVGSDGKVNYKGFKAESAELDKYLAQLSKEVPGNDWSKNEKLAYWINAYNAFTVKLIIDNYPLKSITDLSKPWDTKNINLEGKMYSLGDIENDILRKMNEPRIHFAINCASYSCPNLLNKAFLADKMSSQLSQVTKSFFADESKNDFSSKAIKISKLFDWYSADFANGEILTYINANRSEQLPEKTKISYLEYDWSLNE